MSGIAVVHVLESGRIVVKHEIRRTAIFEHASYARHMRRLREYLVLEDIVLADDLIL